ncbi:MAG: phage antirepressor KilAC domain-containing protein [Blautia sp.]
MNELQIFSNEEFGEIRTVQLNNETYFVGKDVATALGYERATKAIQDHVDAEDKDEIPIQDSIGRMQNTPIITESGVYALIFGSKLESAKRFKHWVTSEVLPSIRKHGVYAVDELLNNPDMAIKAFTALKEEREKNKLLQADNDRMKPKEIFADAVATSKQSILIGQLAKLICQNGHEIGQQRLFRWMRENGYLMKHVSNYNMPMQRYVEQGLFEIKESAVTNPDGSVRITKTTVVTGKGQVYFINKFLGVTY